MLTHIHIRDFAIIDEAELDLSGGMTVLTGETGTGKSILIDALGMVLGDRADSDSVRHGQKRADISAGFDINGLTAVRAWLEEQALDHDDECILRRVISAEGRSKGFINGSPAPLQSMKELGEMLVEIHGQHQHQSLLKATVQRDLLDDYGNNLQPAAELRRLHRDWKATAEKLEALRQAASEREKRLDLLRYHLQELESLDLNEGETETLEEEHRRLANSDQTLESCNRSLNALYDADEQSLHQLLCSYISELEPLGRKDPALAGVSTTLSEAAIQIQEASNELRHYIDGLEPDPERLSWLEERLDEIHHLARKHHIEPEALPQLQQRLGAELAALENADVELGNLEQQLEQLKAAYLATAAKLSAGRQKAALALGKAVSGLIRELGMPNGEFLINLLPRKEGEFHSAGLESISFDVSSNPGQPPRPLAKVASGGELSRISLAIQVLLAKGQQIPTLIFDEVDTGVGGAVAETVGRQLRTLGNSHQVLCVTHLPQVAALGHQHLQVSKQSGKDHTSTRLMLLDKDQRQEEIARMLGGVEITHQTRAHAGEMIDRAEAV